MPRRIGKWVILPPPGKGDEWENAVDEEEVEEEDENNGNPTPAALALRSNLRPIYPTDQIKRDKVTLLTGKYVHMNWGWGPRYNTNWYAADGEWKVNSSNYKWKRKMLVVTGHR